MSAPMLSIFAVKVSLVDDETAKNSKHTQFRQIGHASFKPTHKCTLIQFS